MAHTVSYSLFQAGSCSNARGPGVSDHQGWAYRWGVRLWVRGEVCHVAVIASSGSPTAKEAIRGYLGHRDCKAIGKLSEGIRRIMRVDCRQSGGYWKMIGRPCVKNSPQSHHGRSAMIIPQWRPTGCEAQH